ncbi:PAS domain-containing protein [Pyxidicoccus parkwayensis]|uniref:histidine kinase n=1 Tax=Pyxidicoccus parkwayensis TaxID=2813578 RepID=A0ABX7NWT7_9BACT|nr:PAS domain-containing sensor histidine kinase [Pyxidicoccus parkwaysis]QSQ23178.1 PAS domain-containing protein [Pyxidicoccus parkwaysis]
MDDTSQKKAQRVAGPDAGEDPGEARFQALAEATGELTWLAGPEGQFQTLPPAWCAFTGQSDTDLPHDGWLGPVHPEDREPARRRWQEALATGSRFLATLRLRRRDGTYRDMRVRAVPVRGADGDIREWVGVHTDITDLRESEAERARLALALERTHAELDQFAYVASHDLKAPLRAISNLSQWLEEDLGPSLGEGPLRQLELLRGRVRRLEALIDGILDYSRAGRVRHALTRVDVTGLLDEAWAQLSAPPSARLEVGPGMPVLLTERPALLHVFRHLLGNAVRHARREDVLVRVGVSGDAAEYTFRVEDNGQGIPARFHDIIWGVFQTLEARDKVEGTGIGLSVVRRLVEARGGRAWVESTGGAGATFLFTWRESHEEGGFAHTS